MKYLFICFCLPSVISNASSDERFCDKDSINCDSSQTVEWHEFDWKSYIAKDVQSEDYIDPIKRFSTHLLNSNRIGVNRTVPDNRNPQCASKIRNIPGSPDVSVIITFRDEPRSTLLRTVVSVLERSPSHLINEIILIDDNNDDAEVGHELQSIKKVKVIRNEKREGLIRSRIKGTLLASGQVLVFLDSHCEVQSGWLEPLLERIMANPKRLVCPIIDNISYENFEFLPVSSYLRGGFDWKLDFFWEWLPSSDRARRARDPTSPFTTPTIAGGLFAIDREWFIKLGIYDEEMEIWGGENIEISLRMWMCGGEMEIVPCSRVGHIYKKKNVYSYPKNERLTVMCNSKRVARTWLDQFGVLYNFTLTSAELKEECGGVSKMVKIRKDLQCKTFEWYLSNVYPELMVPSEGDFAFGQIHAKPSFGFIQCLDQIAMGSDEGLVGMNGCLQSFHPQQHRYTFEGQIVKDDFCFTSTSEKPGQSILVDLCLPNMKEQQWDRVRPPKKDNSKLSGYFLKNRATNLCLDVSKVKTSKGVITAKCDENSDDQRFLFSYQIVKA